MDVLPLLELRVIYFCWRSSPRHSFLALGSSIGLPPRSRWALCVYTFYPQQSISDVCLDLRIRSGFIAGVCAPGNATAHIHDPPPPRNARELPPNGAPTRSGSSLALPWPAL